MFSTLQNTVWNHGLLTFVVNGVVLLVVFSLWKFTYTKLLQLVEAMGAVYGHREGKNVQLLSRLFCHQNKFHAQHGRLVLWPHTSLESFSSSFPPVYCSAAMPVPYSPAVSHSRPVLPSSRFSTAPSSLLHALD